MRPFLKQSFQARGLGRSLLTLLLLLAGLGELRANLKAKVTNVVLPIQQYAAIDLSGSVQGNNDINMVALDDGNNAAFEFSTDSQNGDPSGQNFGEWYAEGGSVYSYTWKNGISAAAHSTNSLTGEYPSPFRSNETEYAVNSPASLTASGIMNFNITHMYAYLNTNGLIGFLGDDSTPAVSGGTPPFPYLLNNGILGVDENGNNIYRANYVAYWIDAVSPNGNNVADFCGVGSHDPSTGESIGFNETYILYNGSYVSFDTNTSYISSTPANVTVIQQPFSPYGINDNGWAIGSDSFFSINTNALLWNGGSLISLGLGYSSGINDQNQVIANAYDANWNFLGGYLWDNGTKTAFWDVLPKMTQHQYTAGAGTTLSCTVAPYS